VPAAGPPIFSVAEINAIVRELIEGEFSDIAITGETSNVRVHSSGHVYFRLKDAGAQLAAVCFRSDARMIDFDLEDGIQVVARGRLTVYEAQGSYQLVVRTIEPAGRGDLERQYRLLVAKLQAEGLFDEARKRPLPRYPRRVAVVTSPTGAAIRDILSTLERRFPCVDVIFVPVRVQGDLAPGEIVRALDTLSSRGNIDAIIVGRGGGSIEDLWAFNDEEVARAIHRCAVPVVSAVGHESDVTIADLVADRRAATPTMAAEIVVPDRRDVQRHVDALARSLATRIRDGLQSRRRRVAECLGSYALGQVAGRVERAMQTVDFAITRLLRAETSRAHTARARIDATLARLDGLDPRQVLRRGYTVCTDAESGCVVRAAADAVASRDVHLTFSDGSVAAEVSGTVQRREASR